MKYQCIFNLTVGHVSCMKIVYLKYISIKQNTLNNDILIFLTVYLKIILETLFLFYLTQSLVFHMLFFYMPMMLMYNLALWIKSHRLSQADNNQDLKFLIVLTKLLLKVGVFLHTIDFLMFRQLDLVYSWLCSECVNA